MNDFHIWSGIHDGFADAPATGEGFSSARYRERTLTAIREDLASLEAGRPISQFHKQRCASLPPLIAAMLRDRSRVSILDFGGGLGIAFLTLLESIPGIDQCLRYDIVEMPAVCEDARSLYHGRAIRPVFHDLLPPAESARFDVVFSASALQYVEDWRGLLAHLAGYEANWILLSDVFAGKVRTFASVQNYYESTIPHWFLNIEELLGRMRECGYSLVMKSDVHARRLDQEDVVQMDNFPPEYRITNTWHLLFSRDRPPTRRSS